MNLRSSFFKLPEHRRFYYKSRFSETEEEKAARENTKIEKGRFFRNEKYPLVGAFSSRYEMIETGKSHFRQRLVRTLIILAVLLVLCYFIWVTLSSYQ